MRNYWIDLDRLEKKYPIGSTAIVKGTNMCVEIIGYEQAWVSYVKNNTEILLDVVSKKGLLFLISERFLE